MRLLASFTVALFGLTAHAAEPGWKAGFATEKITPTKPMWMSGYASRTAPAEGTETDLWAKAAVLQDATGRTAVLVTLDLVGINRELSQQIAAPILDRHKLPREALCLSVSHTHCGPVVGTNLRAMYFIDAEQSQRIDEYTAALPGKVAAAVDAAWARLEPVSLTWATGTAGFAVNRRENKEADVPAIRAKGQLKGPNDHTVPVLAARDSGGKLKGVIFGYACHATVLGFQKWCGDYPGFAMIDLEQANPGAVAMFFAGCGADQNPLPRRTVELAKGYGKQLADAVQTVLAKPMNPVAPVWRGTYREISLPLAPLPTREQIAADTTNSNKFVAARAKVLLEKLAREGSLPSTYPYPVQTWRLGNDLTIVTLGGEVVVDYAVRLKKELDPTRTWIMGYSNDVMAYIPSVRVLKEGGYEGASSMIYYGLPTVWGAALEEDIVSEVHRQVKGLAK